MKELKLKKNESGWSTSNGWIVLGKVTGECYYVGDRVNCCAWIDSMDGYDANANEEKLRESGYPQDTESMDRLYENYDPEA